MIRELVTDGTTVLLAAQYLEEADQLAYDIAVIDHGKVIATATPTSGSRRGCAAGARGRSANRGTVGAVAALLSATLHGEPVVGADRAWRCRSRTAGRCRASSVELDDRGIELAEFALRKASLDEVFLALTGHTAEETQDGKQVAQLDGRHPDDGVTVPARRLSPLTGLRNSFTLTWRSVLKLRTNPEDLFGLLLQPIMYLVLFTYVFGGSIAGGTHQYLEFSLQGILVLSVVFATLGTGMMSARTSPPACSTGSAP